MQMSWKFVTLTFRMTAVAEMALIAWRSKKAMGCGDYYYCRYL